MSTFLGKGNSNIMYMDYDSGNVALGAYNPEAKLDVAGDTVMRSNVKALGPVSLCNSLDVAGALTASNNATFASNVHIHGKLTVSNVTYVTSNVFIYSSETVQSNVTVQNNLFVDGIVSFSNTLGVSNVATFGSNVFITGATVASGSATFSNPVTALSNLDVLGPVSLSNTLGVSNVATFGSNVFVKGATVATGSATFSNPVTALSNLEVLGPVSLSNTLGVSNVATFTSNVFVNGTATYSNTIVLAKNGSVVLNTSNNRLGINLGGSNPRAELDISNGNILAKNFHRLGKTADNSNPVSITINWENAFSNNNLYYIIAEVQQTIANGDQAGFRTQRLAIGVSNYNIAWAQAVQVFGSSNAYLNLNVSASASNDKSVTLQSSTTWTAEGSYSHGLNVDIINIVASSNIGTVYLT